MDMSADEDDLVSPSSNPDLTGHPAGASGNRCASRPLFSRAHTIHIPCVELRQHRVTHPTMRACPPSPRVRAQSSACFR